MLRNSRKLLAHTASLLRQQKPPFFPMPITTPRLLIRPPQLSDIKMLHDAIIESFDVLHRTVEWAKKPPTLRESEKYVKSCLLNWKKKNNYPLFVFSKNTNQFIGVGGFHHYDLTLHAIEIGYWIRSSQSGKGLMTEAINAHTQYAFTALKVKRVTIICNPDNIKSKNIPMRLRYTLESILFNYHTNPATNTPGNTLVFNRYDLTDLPALPVSWPQPIHL